MVSIIKIHFEFINENINKHKETIQNFKNQSGLIIRDTSFETLHSRLFVWNLSNNTDGEPKT